MLFNKFNKQTTLVFSIFLITRGLVFLVMYALGCRQMWSNCYAHWDSGLYMQIAEQGHTLFDCNYPNNPQWCGNAGWSPLYPLLIRIVHDITHYPMEHAAGIVTTIFYFFYLKYMARLLHLETINTHSVLMLFLCAFFPGFIYLHAVFPLSLCLFLITAFIYHLQKQDFLYCGFLAMLLSWSYASGLFILLPIAFYFIGILMYERRFAWKEGLKVVIPVLLGLLILFGYEYRTTGRWDAMFLIQAKYKHGFYPVWEMINGRFGRLIETIHNGNGIIQIQNFYVFALVVWLLISVIKEFKKSQFNKPELLFYIGFIIAFWFLPFSMGLDISIYRNCIFLAVLLVFWKDKSLDFKVMLLISFGIFVIPMVAYFLKEIMI